MAPDNSGAPRPVSSDGRPAKPDVLRAAQAAVADFGRRPRRAAAWPGIWPAQLSQRSACFEPRRASMKLSLIVAPFPSSTSLPQLSQTSTVLRAKSIPPSPCDYEDPFVD